MKTKQERRIRGEGNQPTLRVSPRFEKKVLRPKWRPQIDEETETRPCQNWYWMDRKAAASGCTRGCLCHDSCTQPWRLGSSVFLLSWLALIMVMVGHSVQMEPGSDLLMKMIGDGVCPTTKESRVGARLRTEDGELESNRPNRRRSHSDGLVSRRQTLVAGLASSSTAVPSVPVEWEVRLGL